MRARLIAIVAAVFALVVAFGLVAARSSQPASAVSAAAIPVRPVVLPVMASSR